MADMPDSVISTTLSDETISNPFRLSSSSIATLAGALAKAQGEIDNAKAETENPFFKSKYANLGSVWDSIRSPLAKNGLAVIQQTVELDGLWQVATVLAHSSGEWIKSYFPIIAAQKTSQSMGAATTYARRYGLCGMVGAASVEDDDGNQDSKHPNNAPLERRTASPLISKPPAGRSRMVQPKTAQDAQPVDSDIPEFDGPPPGWDDEPFDQEVDRRMPDSILDVLKKAPDAGRALFEDKVTLSKNKMTLTELAKSKSVTPDMLNAMAKKFSGKKDISKLTKPEYDFIYNYVETTKLDAFRKEIIT